MRIILFQGRLDHAFGGGLRDGVGGCVRQDAEASLQDQMGS